ncbi:hypothetical protein [Streptomyces sp. NPDC088400]|uniref:hypothetical protein n=1 Tax=Streptomyces sp. NPDC088400 TaxID=3365861 RepID=UPI0037F72A5C
MVTNEFRTSTGTGDKAIVRLRIYLALDAVVTAVNGLAYVAASGPLERLLGVDSGLLSGLGAFLVLYGVVVGYTAGRPRPPAGAVRAVVGINLLWAVLSIAAVVFDFLGASTAGQVWTVMQAVAVGGFAGLQYRALRRISCR